MRRGLSSPHFCSVPFLPFPHPLLPLPLPFLFPLFLSSCFSLLLLFFIITLSFEVSYIHILIKNLPLFPSSPTLPLFLHNFLSLFCFCFVLNLPSLLSSACMCMDVEPSTGAWAASGSHIPKENLLPSHH